MATATQNAPNILVLGPCAGDLLQAQMNTTAILWAAPGAPSTRGWCRHPPLYNRHPDFTPKSRPHDTTRLPSRPTAPGPTHRCFDHGRAPMPRGGTHPPTSAHPKRAARRPRGNTSSSLLSSNRRAQVGASGEDTSSSSSLKSAHRRRAGGGALGFAVFFFGVSNCS